MNAIALKIREQADPIPPSSDIGAGRACEAAQRACGRIAPLWPLKNFVAVNPFLGMADRRFGEVARVMAEVAGARMTMPRAFYRDAIAQGRITDRDLGQALLRKGSAALAPSTSRRCAANCKPRMWQRMRRCRPLPTSPAS